MSDLYSILYVSKSHIDIYDNPNVLDEITDVSVKNNADAGVTGALLYCGDSFIQVLEGPESKVRETYNRIAEDSRHSDVKILCDEPIDRRAFSKWEMASMIVTNDDDIVKQTMRSGLGFDTRHLSPEAAHVMLKSVTKMG